MYATMMKENCCANMGIQFSFSKNVEATKVRLTSALKQIVHGNQETGVSTSS